MLISFNTIFGCSGLTPGSAFIGMLNIFLCAQGSFVLAEIIGVSDIEPRYKLSVLPLVLSSVLFLIF